MDISELLAAASGGHGQPDITPEQLAHEQAMHDAVHRQAAEAHVLIVRFAPLLCSCRPYFTWGDPAPPQHGCMIHGQLMIDPHTGELL